LGGGFSENPTGEVQRILLLGSRVDKVFQLREVRSSIRRAKPMPTINPNISATTAYLTGIRFIE
jgi:hypothetical protein